jgi:hypothetical protein
LDFNPKLHSVTSLGEYYFRLKPFIEEHMKDITTGIIGSKLPTFKEYGDDKKVDFMISANNQLFQ